MLFTFKRDEESRERVYVGDVCVFVFSNDGSRRGYQNATVTGLTDAHMLDAIERADEAGFWDSRGDAYYVTTQTWKTAWMHNEVTVDIPVAETSTTLTLVREDD